MIEVVGAVFTGLTALTVAIGGLLQQRSTRMVAHNQETEKALERQNLRFRSALAYANALEETLAAAGLSPPARPQELHPSWQPGDEDKKRAVTA